MPRYRVTSEYGGLTVSKVVDAEDEDAAWDATGVALDLNSLGYITHGEINGTYTVRLETNEGEQP